MSYGTHTFKFRCTFTHGVKTVPFLKVIKIHGSIIAYWDYVHDDANVQ